MDISRRHFLIALGFGAGAAVVASVAPALVAVPERKIWQVPRNAPVGAGLRRVGSTDLIFDSSKAQRLFTPLELNAEQGMTYDSARQFFVPFEPSLHPNSSYLAESMAEQDRLIAELKIRFDRYREKAAARVVQLLQAQAAL